MTRKIELHFLSSDREPILFYTVEDVVEELKRYICDDCMNNDWMEYYDSLPSKVDAEHNKLYYLLSTPCGSEFGVKYEDQEWDDIYSPVYDVYDN